MAAQYMTNKTQYLSYPCNVTSIRAKHFCACAYKDLSISIEVLEGALTLSPVNFFEHFAFIKILINQSSKEVPSNHILKIDNT